MYIYIYIYVCVYSHDLLTLDGSNVENNNHTNRAAGTPRAGSEGAVPAGRAHPPRVGALVADKIKSINGSTQQVPVSTNTKFAVTPLVRTTLVPFRVPVHFYGERVRLEVQAHSAFGALHAGEVHLAAPRQRSFRDASSRPSGAMMLDARVLTHRNNT